MKHAFRKIMALALVIAVIIGVLPSVFAANVGDFKDVKDGAWYAKYVEYAVFQDLMNGTSSTTFEPDSPLTRAMTATVLWRLAGEPPVYNKSTFTDLKADWYMNAVAWAQANKVVNGITAKTFEPDTFVTREQIVTMMWRYKGSPAVEGDHLKDYKDAAKVSAYAKDAFNWAISVGIINGDNGNLKPQANATRAEFAKIIYQYAELTKPCSHTWDAGKVTKEATCTDAGEKLFTCSKCGATKTEVIAAKGHTYGEDGKCTVCGAEKSTDPDPKPDPDPDPKPTGDEYVLTNELKDGDKVIFVNKDLSMALSADAASNGFNRVGVAVTPVDNKITTTDTAIVWTIENTEGGFFMKNAKGEKLSVGKKNDTETYNSMGFDQTDNPVWKIATAETEGCIYLQNTTAVGKSGDPKSVEWNTQFSNYSMYYLGSADEKLFAMQMYVKGGTTPTPTPDPDPDPKPDPKPDPDPDPTPGGTYAAANSISVGDTIVITATVGGKNYELDGFFSTSSATLGQTAEFTTNVAATLALEVVAGKTDGTYAFKTKDNKYLSWTAGNSLTTSSELNENASWVVTFNDNGTAKIVNATTAASEAKDQRVIVFNLNPTNNGKPRFAAYTKYDDKVKTEAQYGVPVIYKLG